MKGMITSMNVFPMLMAILAGIFTTIEASINSQLGKYVTPAVATLHSLVTGTTVFLIINIVNGSIIKYQKITQVSPIWLIGGVFGAFIIYLSSKAIPSLGISNTLILLLTGELLCGLLIDALILNHAISVRKMLGLVLFLVGTIVYLQEK